MSQSSRLTFVIGGTLLITLIARMKMRPTWEGLVASIAVHPRQMRALSAYRFDASRMKSLRTPTLLLIGEQTASPYAKQSIDALRA